MSKYELIAGVIIFSLIILGINLPGILQGHCRTEAIKAGMKPAEIQTACHQ
jgi:hypothetical protein